MAMSLAERYNAAEQNPEFRGKIIGALVKHSKYVIRSLPSGAVDHDKQVALARIVLANATNYALPFGLGLLTEPSFDSVNEVFEINDNAVQDTIAELFVLYANVFA